MNCLQKFLRKDHYFVYLYEWPLHFCFFITSDRIALSVPGLLSWVQFTLSNQEIHIQGERRKKVRSDQEWRMTAMSGLVLPSPRCPASTEFKSDYIALWVMNYFSPCNPFHIPLATKKFYTDNFFPRFVILWNRTLSGCFTNHLISSSLMSTVIYPTYPHNLHFLIPPFTFLQNHYSVILTWVALVPCIGSTVV